MGKNVLMVNLNDGTITGFVTVEGISEILQPTDKNVKAQWRNGQLEKNNLLFRNYFSW